MRASCSWSIVLLLLLQVMPSIGSQGDSHSVLVFYFLQFYGCLNNRLLFTSSKVSQRAVMIFTIPVGHCHQKEPHFLSAHEGWSETERSLWFSRNLSGREMFPELSSGGGSGEWERLIFFNLNKCTQCDHWSQWEAPSPPSPAVPPLV